ncbi:aspartate/glutamate racemase family protein [Sagittula stellata]|uniref:Aspartate/glutamate racemase family protein n=1 Tax=Sagittula stellata (strain ATCC 700073 / DSM 11524 / E-37) TaxID=388399 RepID=A3K5K4_SAGS3|nr:aspartate/glutamate racemase family protein [Sagittula stellata]EBA07393.1 hypothetical protein SSE37_21380 [Sagittula stellata E-37]
MSAIPPHDTAAIGILMLDSRFPRIPGDAGNPLSWPFPVVIRVVRGASPQRIVREGGGDSLTAFVDAARALVDDGAVGITTTCGFLSLFQKALAEAVPVPVVTSSLAQVEMVNRTLPAGRVAGILTIAASSLTQRHLAAAHVPAATPIGTTEGGWEFTRAILNDEPALDVALARQDNIDAALALQEANPHLGAIVLECTNMVPYAPAIAAATGLPVYSIHTLVRWMHAGLCPPRFAT